MEQSPAVSQNCSSGVAINGWKDMLDKIRRPCLLADFDLQMQVHPDYATAPESVSKSGNAQSKTPLCDKSETITVKCRVADMVAAGLVASVAIGLLCCCKHMCHWMKKK